MLNPKEKTKFTVFRWFWIVLTTLVLALGYAISSPYMVYSLYVFLFVLIFSYILSNFWISFVVTARKVEPLILNEGEDAEVVVFIRNKSWFPVPWIYVEDFVPPYAEVSGEYKKLFFLRGNEMRLLSYRLRFPRRGYFRIGPLVMETGDFFGLQKHFRSGETQEYVTVLPSVVYIKSFQVSTRRPHGPVRVSNKIYEDPTRIYGVRDYIPGDPIKSIHWKASAKLGSLQVKTNEPATVLGATLILDLFEDDYYPQTREERIELAITTTASISYLLYLSGEPVGLVTNAQDAGESAEFRRERESAFSREDLLQKLLMEGRPEDICPLIVPTRRSSGQIQKILENLARAEPSKILEYSRLLQYIAPYLPRDNALVLVVPQVTEELTSVVEKLKFNGFVITVFLIKDEKAYQEAMLRLGKFSINVFHIEHEQDLFYIAPQKIGV
ncbi:MAG: DUF58 domain-containing protein [Candidatus Hydrogenedentes bacterium]|nr:DUF58 domain-containing protein [Candidatus Hydrogenedentota bacterium]